MLDPNKHKKFLSTPSARRATFQGSCLCFRVAISIHALREEGDSGAFYRAYSPFISIHALREEGDVCLVRHDPVHDDFYPRPPRGGRPGGFSAPSTNVLFLSTPSARRATINKGHPRRSLSISIHALREEGDVIRAPLPPKLVISIHALREEGDLRHRGKAAFCGISIHALREEGDDFHHRAIYNYHNFYPRPPRGGRPLCCLYCQQGKKFLSTPSARRATAKTETKSLFSNKLYNILHEFRRALIYNGSKNYPNHAK